MTVGPEHDVPNRGGVVHPGTGTKCLAMGVIAP